MRLFVYFFILWVVWSLQCIGVRSDNDTHTEYDLHERLFALYNSNIMPRNVKSSDPFQVGIELYMMSIEDINELKQTISIMAFLEITWKDRFLAWTPFEYSNITSINVKVKDIWTPDIVLESTLDKQTDLIDEDGNAIISSDGSVIIWPYDRFTVSCKIFIVQYPFDEQICKFDFLSWTNPSSNLVLNSSSTETSKKYYKESGEWALKRGLVLSERRPTGDDAWDHVVFTLELQRKSLFVVLNVMLPIVFISFLNTFCFMLPSDGGERITFCISIFLTLAVYMTIINGSLPKTSDEVPIFGVYICLQLIGCGLSIIATVLSLYCYHESEDRPVCACLQVLVRVLCMRRGHQKYQQHDINNGKENNVDGKIIKEANDTIDDCVKRNSLTPNVNVTLQHSTSITWRMVSCALDRFCFMASIVWHVVLIGVLLCVMFFIKARSMKS
ncbi:hypothetical protein DPMN_006679 [Dreissena polymorpha]|uniref:Uncharacterized protein n=1 Tax=Dreissena polymorpha TaxID=45954 RepID=A0A9D4RVL1_DREPO|nr:hypothetical protein DPMN_006679 [Dreissena polymorpha]